MIDYLTCRPQYVRLQNQIISDPICTCTGAPQGTVLSPFIFTLYTSDCRHVHDSCHLQKFSDDSAIVGCIMHDDDSAYKLQIEKFVSWCQSNFLELNVSG